MVLVGLKKVSVSLPPSLTVMKQPESTLVEAGLLKRCMLVIVTLLPWYQVSMVNLFSRVSAFNGAVPGYQTCCNELARFQMLI